MDTATLTAGLANSGGFSNSFFTLYYPGLAMFAVVFTSFRLNFAWVTMVAALYTAVSLVIEPGVDFEIKEEKVLFIRIAVMYAVVAAVNLVSRFERIRRREAVERERMLQRGRIELSQTIHDTIAQSAYMIGLGIQTAMELADAREDENRDELLAKLSATHAAVEVDDVGAAASHRRRPHFRGTGVEPGAEVSRLNIRQDHVDSRRTGPVRQRAAAFALSPGACSSR